MQLSSITIHCCDCPRFFVARRRGRRNGFGWSGRWGGRGQLGRVFILLGTLFILKSFAIH